MSLSSHSVVRLLPHRFAAVLVAASLLSPGFGRSDAAIAQTPPDNLKTLAGTGSPSFTPNYAPAIDSKGIWRGRTLRVFFPPESEAVVNAALLRWKEASGGFFTWERVTSAPDAQITFKPTPATEFVKGMVGLTTFSFSMTQNELLEAEVRYATAGTEADRVRVVQHEIGHAIGIHGHSDTVPDVMCPRVSRRNAITERDVNTLLWLYRPEVVAKLSRTKRGAGRKKTQTITCGTAHR